MASEKQIAWAKDIKAAKLIEAQEWADIAIKEEPAAAPIMEAGMAAVAEPKPASWWINSRFYCGPQIMMRSLARADSPMVKKISWPQEEQWVRIRKAGRIVD